MSNRKTFTAGQPVEVIPEALGRRRDKPQPADWQLATYRHPGRDEMEGWHFVTVGARNVHVPARRIRPVSQTTSNTLPAAEREGQTVDYGGEMKRVIIESPFSAPTPEGIERNIRYLRACMRDCLLRGEAPYASHALYTQPGVLRDEVPEERVHGIQAGFAWRPFAHATVVYSDLGITGGMNAGIDDAKRIARLRGEEPAIEYRNLPCWDCEGEQHAFVGDGSNCERCGQPPANCQHPDPEETPEAPSARLAEPAIYPGHPVTIALLIVEAYPSLADAERKCERTGYPAALGSADIPGAGGNVRAALRLLQSVRAGALLAEAVEHARDYWSRCDGQATGDARLVERWRSGQEQADRVEPVLRAKLAVWP